MEESSVETKETLTQKPEIVDILSGRFSCHWTAMENLPKILSKGIYSATFAKRIRDKNYSPRSHPVFPRSVFVNPYFEEVFGDPEKVIGIVVEISGRVEVPIRIAPRKFVGVVLLDKRPAVAAYPPIPRFLDELSDPVKARTYVLERIEQIKTVFESEKRSLPIYGLSGDLYWPRRMTHKEIVQMLKTKEEGVV